MSMNNDSNNDGAAPVIEASPLVPVNYEPQGSGFFRQVWAAIRRQLVQKKRSIGGTLVEIFLPVFFVLCLVAASKAASFKDNPEAQFMPEPSVAPINMHEELKPLVCTTDDTIPHDIVPLCPFTNISSDAARGFVCSIQDGVTGPQIPFQMCVQYQAGPLLQSWMGFETNIGIPMFDDMVVFQAVAKLLLFKEQKHLMWFSAMRAAFGSGGSIYFIPRNPITERLEQRLKTSGSSRLFSRVFKGYFNSRGDAIEYSSSVSGAGKVWAFVSILNLAPTLLNVELSMNKTLIPWTQNKRDLFSQGLGEKAYSLYFFAGFLTLQQTLNLDFIHNVLNISNARSPYKPVTMAPMPYGPYKNSKFFTIAGRIAPLVLVLSYLFPVSQLAKRLVEEKEQRLREGTMVMGLSKAAFFTSWHLVYYVQAFISVTIMTIVLKGGLLTGSDGTVIFVVFLLFAISTVNLSSLLSSFFGKSRLTGQVVPIIFFVIAVPSFALPQGTSKGILLMLSMFSPSAFSVACKLLFQYEINHGMGWGDVGSKIDEINMGTAMGFLLFDSVLYILIMLYVDAVLKSEWGTNLHPCFCFLWPFKKKNTLGGGSGASDDEAVPFLDAAEKEKSPGNTPTGNGNGSQTTSSPRSPVRHFHEAIEHYPGPDGQATVCLRNLRKEFEAEHGTEGKKVAVNDFELKLFPDQITVLLGHNGAGKTTTMNMITGMLPMTAGDCHVYGKSVHHDLTKVRKEIGFCPQHNILWKDLTCREHLQFFARLKGVPSNQVDHEAQKMLVKVDLLDKSEVLSVALSGGQKRKLSVAIAFIGGSRFVLLDEPTAGMDVAARRHTWDLLREMSKGRTIVLSTHFMDEADLLGNRIAIMSKGALHSYGSPMFLKARLGTGYVLRFSLKAAVSDAKPLLQAVQEHLPEAGLKEAKGQEVAVSLPMSAAAKFSKTIGELEKPESKKKFGVTGISMSVSTLEDVFLQIAEEEEMAGTPEDQLEASSSRMHHQEGVAAATIASTDATTSSSPTTAARTSSEEMLEKCFSIQSQPSGAGRQIGALFKKRINNQKRDKRTLCMQIVVPLLSVVFAMLLSKLGPPEQHPLKIDVGMYGGEPQAVSLNDCGEMLPYFNDGYFKDAQNWPNTYNFSNGYLMPTALKHGGHERYVAASCNDQSQIYDGTFADVLFTNASAFHSAPQIVNEYYQAKARQLLAAQTPAGQTPPPTSIWITTNLLPFSYRQKNRIDGIITLFIALFILIPFTMVPSTFVAWVVKERECKAKHLQFVSGVNFVAYWVSNFMFDSVAYLVTELIALIIFAAFKRDEYVGDANTGFCTFLLFLFYGLSSITAAYAVSFLFKTHGQAQNVVMMANFICGFVLVITIFILDQIDSAKSVAKVLGYIFRVVPSFCLGNGLLHLATAPARRKFGIVVDVYAMEETGMSLLFMGLEVIVFGVLAMLIDHPSRQKKQQLLQFDRNKKPDIIDVEDEDVLRERNEIENDDPSRADDVVTVKNLRKVYTECSPSKVAVQNISFGVKKGEVYGFLGTNGAGKTTTMSILTGEFLPTMGHAKVAGFDVVEEAGEARKVIGYCPQFDALIDLMTAEEHLELYAVLRGIPPGDVQEICNALIVSCGLEQHRKVASKKLSGGNKRKLSVAIALIGAPRIVFLDEPSAGMDPAARRMMWDVIIFVAKRSSVVLTTHHLEEVDVLAHRVAIMVDGLMKCVGSLDHLKHKFGGGFELSVKVDSEEHEDGVIQMIQKHFSTGVLVEQRQKRLTFSLPFADVKLSHVFAILQEAKDSGTYGVTDYTVQQTSLEQVFMRISSAALEEAEDVAVAESQANPHAILSSNRGTSATADDFSAAGSRQTSAYAAEGATDAASAGTGGSAPNSNTSSAIRKARGASFLDPHVSRTFRPAGEEGGEGK